jgi:hypothetical protein
MVNSCPAFTAVCRVRLFTALPGEPPFNSVPLGRVRIGWSKYTPPLVLVRR